MKAVIMAQCPYCNATEHQKKDGISICHVRAINTFADDTPVAVVSGVNNLIALCPNCHWEFDQGLVVIDEPAAD
jgi:predicted restriction endonuclease